VFLCHHSVSIASCARATASNAAAVGAVRALGLGEGERRSTIASSAIAARSPVVTKSRLLILRTRSLPRRASLAKDSAVTPERAEIQRRCFIKAKQPLYRYHDGTSRQRFTRTAKRRAILPDVLCWVRRALRGARAPCAASRPPIAGPPAGTGSNRSRARADRRRSAPPSHPLDGNEHGEGGRHQPESVQRIWRAHHQGDTCEAVKCCLMRRWKKLSDALQQAMPTAIFSTV